MYINFKFNNRKKRIENWCNVKIKRRIKRIDKLKNIRTKEKKCFVNNER